MSCRSEAPGADPSAVANAIEGASLVQLLPRPDGDALAAAGILARALEGHSIPYQIAPAATREARIERAQASDTAAVTVALGSLAAVDHSLSAADGTVSIDAAAIADRLGAAYPPELALAGSSAAGGVPGDDDSDWLLDRAKARGLTRRPGVAVPVDDLVDGLAHSLRCHAEWSGEPEAVASALTRLSLGGDPRQSDTFDESDHRTIASLAAIDATETETQERSAATIGRLLRPYATPAAPFETLGGYADVLDATARERPGVAVALAVGGDVREAALAAWRRHAQTVHQALEAASTGRYDGYVVARIDGSSVVSTAKLCRDVIAPEPVVVAVGATSVGIATRNGTDAAELTRELATALDGAATASSRYGYVEAAETPVDERHVVEIAREVL